MCLIRSFNFIPLEISHILQILCYNIMPCSRRIDTAESELNLLTVELSAPLYSLQICWQPIGIRTVVHCSASCLFTVQPVVCSLFVHCSASCCSLSSQLFVHCPASCLFTVCSLFSQLFVHCLFTVQPVVHCLFTVQPVVVHCLFTVQPVVCSLFVHCSASSAL